MKSEEINQELDKISDIDLHNLENEIFEELECYIACINGFYILDDEVQKSIVNAYIQGYTTKALKTMFKHSNEIS